MAKSSGSIRIDGKHFSINEDDKTIADITKREKITLPTPCYNSKREKGCCNACVVEIDGEQKFACVTEPVDEMEITIDREDLNNIRKENLAKYQEGIKSGKPSMCSCSCSESGCC